METTTLQRIGVAIRELRKTQNVTQEELAEYTETAISYIGTIERGEQNMTLQTLDKIAQALQTDIFNLLSISQKESPAIRKISALLITQDDFHQQKALNIVSELLREP